MSDSPPPVGVLAQQPSVLVRSSRVSRPVYRLIVCVKLLNMHFKNELISFKLVGKV